MKYTLLSDINFILKKKKKILITLALIIILFFITNLLNKFSGVLLYTRTLGINCTDPTDILPILSYLLCISISLYIVFNIFTKDLKYGLDNLFLRIKPKHWVLYKVLSIGLIITILKLVLHTLTILLIVIFQVDSINIYKIMNYLLLDISYTLIINYSLILIYIISSKFKLFIYILVLTLIPFIKYLTINIISINNKLMYVFILIITIIILIYNLYKYLYINVFENK